MNKVIYNTVQWTWGSLQSTAGAVCYLIYKDKPHYNFQGACVTVWPKDVSLSLGKFIFLTDTPHRYFKSKKNCTLEEISEQILVHEYGHTIQSLVLGPLYLVVIGIPSLTWGSIPALHKLRTEKQISYFDLFCEKNANYLGELVSKKKSIGRAF